MLARDIISVLHEKYKIRISYFSWDFEPRLVAFVFLLWGIVTETALLLFFTTERQLSVEGVGGGKYLIIGYDNCSTCLCLALNNPN